jgi:hypothetical protein
MTPEDAKRSYFLKLLGGDPEALLEKFRRYEQEFDPTSTSPENLSRETRDALEFIEKGAGKLPEEDRARYIAHLEKLSFIRAKLEQDKSQE